jgi:hypothetical protein
MFSTFVHMPVCPSLDPLGRSGLTERRLESSSPFRAQAASVTTNGRRRVYDLWNPCRDTCELAELTLWT